MHKRCTGRPQEGSPTKTVVSGTGDERRIKRNPIHRIATIGVGQPYLDAYICAVMQQMLRLRAKQKRKMGANLFKKYLGEESYTSDAPDV